MSVPLRPSAGFSCSNDDINVVSALGEIIKFIGTYAGLEEKLFSWRSFNDMIDAVEQSSNEDLRIIGDSVTKIHRLWQCSQHSIEKAIQEIRIWCEHAVRILPVFLGKWNGDIGHGSYNLLRSTLAKWRTTFEAVSALIDKCHNNQQEAATALLALNVDLCKVMDKGYAPEAEVQGLRTEANAAALKASIASVATGAATMFTNYCNVPCVAVSVAGLLAAILVSVGVVEEGKVPILRKCLEKAKLRTQELERIVAEANDRLQECSLKCESEEADIQGVNVQVADLEGFGTQYPDESTVRESTETVIKACKEYIQKRIRK